jgi:hypothetical protein
MAIRGERHTRLALPFPRSWFLQIVTQPLKGEEYNDFPTIQRGEGKAEFEGLFGGAPLEENDRFRRENRGSCP